MYRRNEIQYQAAAHYVATPPAANVRFPDVNYESSGPPQANIGYTPQNQFLYGAQSVCNASTLPWEQLWQDAPAGQCYRFSTASTGNGQLPTSVQVQFMMPEYEHPVQPLLGIHTYQESQMPSLYNMFPQAGARACKKALIIGCNYADTPYELKGCINDTRNIEIMLQRHFNFQTENIRLLTDDGQNFRLPTKDNIMTSIKWLLKDVQFGDSLFFHYSGHGSQKPDCTGDESDGKNETLLPCDFESRGEIVDDDLNDYLINWLPSGVCLHAVIDACHSGTAMDLEYFTQRTNGSIEWRREKATQKFKGTAGGTAVLFSACDDKQKAQDTDRLTGGVHTGAATHAFIEAIVENGPTVSYSDVLSHMYDTMEQLPPDPSGRMSMSGTVYQTPQISSNVQLNLAETLHI